MDGKQKIGALCGKEKILLVDTDIAIWEMCQLLLESLGYRVISASTPEKAIGYLAAEPDAYDLVITDTSLLEVNGDKLSPAIVKICPHLPVILHTAITPPAYPPDALRQVIQRPAFIPDLAAAVRGVLDAGISEQAEYRGWISEVSE